jgi:endonuclease/exonuclease/phosphatase family metal-dependent hydrolase
VSLLRVINWNIAIKGSIEEKMNYLQSVLKEKNVISLVAFQEVTEKDRDYLSSLAIFSSRAFSLNFRKPGPYDTTNRKLGCFIGIVGNVQGNCAGVIERAPFPERTLFMDLAISNFPFKIICFHSLTGVGYKKTKTSQYIAIAEYLQKNKEVSTICCFDANEPEIDHYDIEKVKFFDQKGDRGVGAGLVMGAAPVHNMKDTFRTWLEGNDYVIEEMKRKQDHVSGEKELKYVPLTTSYIVNKKYNKRYDYIFASNEFKVKNVEYRLEQSLKAGSDHAMVVTDLEIV